MLMAQLSVYACNVFCDVSFFYNSNKHLSKAVGHREIQRVVGKKSISGVT